VIKGETFSLITGSHLFDISPQELSRNEALNFRDENEVEKAAKKINPSSELRQINITDGEYLLFNGKLWHGTKNTTGRDRYALTFRYATPADNILISKDGELINPTWEKRKPLCIIAAGEDNIALNTHLPLKKISKHKGLLLGLVWSLPRNLKTRFVNHYSKYR
jgi:hypothetical protein